jgi:putative transposase
VVTVAQRREAVEYLKAEFSLSQRRACQVVRLHRSTSRYAKQRGEDKELRERLRLWAARRPRWGYRLLHWQLTEEGFRVNRKKVLRLYREEGLRIRRRRRKHVAAAPREKLAVPTGENERWSMDFVADELADGRSLRILNTVDDFSRECPGLEVDRSLPAERVIALLERIAKERPLPKTIVVDNGPEFASKALHAWARRRGITLHFIDPGKPTQNPFIESLNGTLREECLNAEVFEDVPDSRTKIERWRRCYNTRRPHSSLGDIPPAEFARRARAQREAQATESPGALPPDPRSNEKGRDQRT